MGGAAARRLGAHADKRSHRPILSIRRQAVSPDVRAARAARLRLGALRMSEKPFVIAIIDDDDVLREAVAGLLVANEYEVEHYGSAEAFLASVARSRASC